ncbi:MAG TPA: hypothetical protein VGJ63_05055 [Micromonosporaceae bacterium]|jgi:hypothetical protein
MRLTVGPLPPAVYWRRRAVVVGALLLVVIVFTYSCGPESSGASPQGRSATTASAGDPTATVMMPTPQTGSPAETDPAASNPGETDATPTSTSAAVDQTGPCSDEEMSVIPVPARTTAGAGESLDVRLRIKNISSRTCSRDVGADLQELRIVEGATAEKVWSSDDCGAARGTDVRSFPPNYEREYLVTWNGRASTKCTSGMPGGPVPAAGAYQVFGRLGTKLSDPVTLTIG